jgi:hypothetical protein
MMAMSVYFMAAALQARQPAIIAPGKANKALACGVVMKGRYNARVKFGRIGNLHGESAEARLAECASVLRGSVAQRYGASQPGSGVNGGRLRPSRL